MKYIKQFAIIGVVSFVGDLLNKLIPLPIPGSIYGLIIMFTALNTKIIKLSSIEDILQSQLNGFVRYLGLNIPLQGD